MVGVPLCTDDGDLYYRLYKGGRSEDAPLVRIGKDGSEVDTVDIRDAVNAKRETDSAETFGIYDATVLGNDVYVLGATNHGSVKVVRVDGDKVRAVIKLDREFTPAKLGVFGNGNMAVFGMRSQPAAGRSGGPLQFQAIADLYNSAGQFQRHLDLKAPEIDLSNADPKASERTISLDLAHVASTPNVVYVLPFTPKHPVVYEIDPGGTFIRRIRLWTPWTEAQNFKPTAFLANETGLFVRFTWDAGNRDVDRFVEYSALNGDVLHDYVQQAKGIFACYDWRGGFTLLANTAGRQVLRFARSE
jgi:hypothetical protein